MHRLICHRVWMCLLACLAGGLGIGCGDDACGAVGTGTVIIVDPCGFATVTPTPSRAGGTPMPK